MQSKLEHSNCQYDDITKNKIDKKNRISIRRQRIKNVVKRVFMAKSKKEV